MSATSLTEMTTNFGKLEKFEGVNFRRWQQKMHFLLTNLKGVHVSSSPIPEAGDDAPIDAIRKRSKWENDDCICRGHILNCMCDPLFDLYQNVESAKELWDALEVKYMQEDASSKKFLVSNFNSYKMVDARPVIGDDAPIDAIRKRSKWENDDCICRGHILNCMCDPLFDLYQNVESAKELWDALEVKYMQEDASNKKFLVSNFNSYKMVDVRPVMEKFNELTRILGQFAQYKMKMDDTIAVSSIIDKLPPLWKDFKHSLKHNKEEMTLQELGGELRIEESIRMQEDAK
ncbi:unnamed protein product [Rhodiola kirilowii]